MVKNGAKILLIINMGGYDGQKANRMENLAKNRGLFGLFMFCPSLPLSHSSFPNIYSYYHP